MGPAHLLLLAVSLPYIASLHTQLHKHMSPDELRSVFYVDHHSLVPEYQLIQLNHHVSKRHVASAGGDDYHASNKFARATGKKSAHDKSSDQDHPTKNAHKFSDLSNFGSQPAVRFIRKQNAAPDIDEADFIFVGSDNLKSVNDAERTIKSDTGGGVNVNSVESENGQVIGDSTSENGGVKRDMKDVEHVDEDVEEGVHKIKFEAFGKPIELKLRKTEGLFKKDGLKIWTVVGNETQPHGVEFLESEELGSEKDHIGETYQDQDTMAALIIRRDPLAGLVVEGTIGHDMVIKPLPATLTSGAPKQPPFRKTIPPEQDDEMFMDPNQEDMVSIDTGLPIKRSKVSKKNLSSKVKTPEKNIADIIKEAEESEQESNKTETINKMDYNDDVIFDDEGAKEEGRRFKDQIESTAGEDLMKSSSTTVADLRRELIEALSGARHVIYKRDTPPEVEPHEEFSDYAFMEPDRLQKRYRNKREAVDDGPAKSRKKRSAPGTIYPEILVIVDYDGYKLHERNNADIKKYFVSFWNGVDLRYKQLKGPKIRISIAGIIISRGPDATPYLENNRVGRDAIDSAAALTDMGKYLFRERRLPVYDIAVAVTKYDMCRRRKGGRCTKGTAGFAYVGGACVVNKRLEKVNSVAIIEDTGGFSGIIVAAHEVGHLLGAVHDGSPPPSYLGGPGADKCRWEDGFIMSDLRHTEKGFHWSQCSTNSFHHFLNSETATCLFNSPHEDESLSRVLPGTLLTLDAQCRKDRGTTACFKDERVCAQLFCFDAGSGYCVAYRPAAEGSPCGDGQHCINGRCVTQHENIIPDYSQHTPSYIRTPFFVNGTGHRYLYEQTTSAYQTVAGGPYRQTFYYPNTGQSPQAVSVIQSSPQYRQYTYTTQRPFPIIYNSIPATRQGLSLYSYQTPTENPFGIRRVPLYHYTAETKQTEYTVPAPSSALVRSTESTTSTTTQRPFILKYIFSTTKNPYDFKDFTTRPPLSKINATSTTLATSTLRPDAFRSSTKSSDAASTTRSTPSTSIPKYGFLNKLDFRDYFNRTTTKNPYDFDLSNYKEISNNNIKRSYSIKSYFAAPNSPVAKIVSPDETLVAEASRSVVPVQPRVQTGTE